MSIWWSNRVIVSALLVGALTLSACGFRPIHKVTLAADGPIALVALAVPDTQNGRLLATALRGRWQARADAAFDVSVVLEETARNTQLDARGVAARIELDYVLRVTLRMRATPDESAASVGQSKGFVLRHSESMARSDSGAADLTQQRNLARLAMQNLAERLILRLSQEVKR